MPSKSKKTNTLLTAGTLGGIAAVIAAIATLWTAIVPNQPNNNENDSNFSSRFTTADVEGSVFNEINKPIKNAEVVLNNSTSTKMKTDGMGGFLFENVVTNKKHNLSVYDQGTMIFWKYFKIPESQNFFKLDLQTGYIVSPTNPDKSIRNDVKLPVIPINNSENKVQFLNSSSSVAYDIALNQKGYKIPESNLKPGSNQFNFTFWISTDSKTLHKIDKVTYYLHPTFNPQVVTKTSASKNFSISFTGWGTFDIKAKVYFKDGEVKDLIYPATKWTK